MRLLLDECVPRRLKREFVGHEVKTAREAGLAGFKNGDLLRAAQNEFDALITVDKSIPYQQNVKSFQIAVVVLLARRNKYEQLKSLVPKALEVLTSLRPGNVATVEPEPYSLTESWSHRQAPSGAGLGDTNAHDRSDSHLAG
jgi:hypothetical protein